MQENKDNLSLVAKLNKDLLGNESTRQTVSVCRGQDANVERQMQLLVGQGNSFARLSIRLGRYSLVAPFNLHQTTTTTTTTPPATNPFRYLLFCFHSNTPDLITFGSWAILAQKPKHTYT